MGINKLAFNIKKKIVFAIVIIALSSQSVPVVASLTLEDERKLGGEIYDNLEKNKLIYHNARIGEYIRKVGKQIISQVSNSPFEYRFFVINSWAINAFATPGGYVYVNVGLINLAENESELAGVLAHEIAHVSSRHISDIVDKSTKVNMASLAAILAGAFLGGSGDVTAAVASFSLAAAATMNLKYSREHEEEADRLGLSYLINAGYDGQSMLDFLKSMRRYEFYSSNVPSYFMTHPGTDERIRYLDGILQTRYSPSGSKSLFGQLKRVQTLLMLEKKDFAANLKYFEAALVKNQDDIDSLYGLAVTQGKLGMTEQSMDNFQKALTKTPTDRDILRDLGIALLTNGRSKEAIAALRKAVELGEEDATALSYLGKAYESADDYPSAIGIYKKLAAGNPQDDEVLYRLAFAYGKTKNQGESHYNFGLHFMKKGKLESALFHFREALKHFPPDSPQAKDILKQMKSQKTPAREKPEKKTR